MSIELFATLELTGLLPRVNWRAEGETVISIITIIGNVDCSVHARLPAKEMIARTTLPLAEQLSQGQR
jgi:hypothetical protein